MSKWGHAKDAFEYLAKRLRLRFAHTPYVPGWKFHSLSPDCTSRFFSVLDDFLDQAQACLFGHLIHHCFTQYGTVPSSLSLTLTLI